MFLPADRMKEKRQNTLGTWRRRRHHVAGAGLAVLAMALLLVGTPSLSAHPEPRTLPALRLDYEAYKTSLSSLDPALAGFDDTIFLVQANLVHVLPNGRVAADLASRWTVSKSRRVYTFSIRPNARFSNGHYVTARDVVFSLKRALAPSTKSPLALSYLRLIRGAQAFNSGEAQDLAGVKVLGRLTLQITLTQPAGYFLDTLSYPSADVLDPAVVAGKPMGDPNDGFKRNFLTTTCTGNQGAGPFVFACHDGSSTVHSFYAGNAPMYTLVPNPYYYGPKPRIRLELPAFGDKSTAYKRYLAGKLDTGPLPIQYLRQWQGKKELLEFPASTVRFLVPNTHLAPFDNVHCRLAVAYAIDKVAIAASVLHGTQRPTYAVVPRDMLGYYAGDDNPHFKPSRAREEFARCPNRTAPVDLKYYGGFPEEVNEFTYISKELKAIGMNVRSVPLSRSEWYADASQPLDRTGTQLITTGWVQDYPDPQDYLFNLLHSGAPFNFGAWHNITYDRLVDRADALTDRKERAKLYIQAQHIALAEGAIFVLMDGRNFELVRPHVHGLVGTEAYATLEPKDLDWSNVSISNQ